MEIHFRVIIYVCIREHLRVNKIFQSRLICISLFALISIGKCSEYNLLINLANHFIQTDEFYFDCCWKIFVNFVFVSITFLFQSKTIKLQTSNKCCNLFATLINCLGNKLLHQTVSFNSAVFLTTKKYLFIFQCYRLCFSY